VKYRKLNGWKYELMSPLSVYVPELENVFIDHPFGKIEGGSITVEKGYAWDGATGIPDNPDNMRASLFHDFLYQLMREGSLDRSHRDIADQLCKRLCLADGMDEGWVDFVYNGLKVFGKSYVFPDKRPKGQIIEI